MEIFLTYSAVDNPFLAGRSLKLAYRMACLGQASFVMLSFNDLKKFTFETPLFLLQRFCQNHYGVLKKPLSTFFFDSFSTFLLVIALIKNSMSIDKANMPNDKIRMVSDSRLE